jgi:hypothetical protein
MKAQKLSASHGWLWVKQGIYLFKKSPILWVVITFIAMAGLMGVSTLPLIGEPLSSLLFPVLYAGLLVGCQALEHDQELELAHLFAGFKQNTSRLVTLGGLMLMAQLLIFGVMMLTGGSALVSILMGGVTPDDPAVIVQAVASAGVSIIFGIALFTVLMMANQFAPMLVMFKQQTPIQAMKASVQVFLQNIAPLSVYGVIMLLFAVMASLPMMLGWLILLPIMVTSLYAAFRGLFPNEEELVSVIESPVVEQVSSEND